MNRTLLPPPSLLAALALVGCATAAPKPTRTVAAPAPSVITETTLPDATRHFYELDRQDPRRAELRQRIVGYLLSRTNEVFGRDSYDALVEHMARLTSYYAPDEFVTDELPPGLEVVARELVQQGEPRGDEAAVLSGLFTLHTLRPRDRATAKEYARLAKWTRESRSALGGPMERFQGLVQVWEMHAQLTPAREVLDRLASYYVARREAMVELLRSAKHRIPLTTAVLQSVQQTSLAVAGVYLRHGDVASALGRVERMGSSGGVEDRLIEMLEAGTSTSTSGAGAILELARLYREGGAPGVTQGLCRHGLRVWRDDPRFPQCLARVAALRGDYTQAMGWYGRAIELAPDDRALYDNVLSVLNGLIEQGKFDVDPTRARKLGKRAVGILQERMRRWPDDPPPVKLHDLYRVLGTAEMNAGNAADAEALLRRSVQARPTAGALQQLAMLMKRTGRYDRAAAYYRRALKRLSTAPERQQRAELLEHLGDVLRLVGDPEAARAHYEQALDEWDHMLEGAEGEHAGVALARRGVLLDRLGHRPAAFEAFDKAMRIAPGVQEVYSIILAHLVVADPDHEFAQSVFRIAMRQLSLAPEWKVYYALWIGVIRSRAGQAANTEASQVLEDMAQGRGWPAQLARFASGGLSYAELLQAAGDVGQRTEAHFYEGTRQLAEGDQDAAKHAFRRVLQTQMVNFYEYTMAFELLANRGSNKSEVSIAKPKPDTDDN